MSFSPDSHSSSNNILKTWALLFSCLCSLNFKQDRNTSKRSQTYGKPPGLLYALHWWRWKEESLPTIQIPARSLYIHLQLQFLFQEKRRLQIQMEKMERRVCSIYDHKTIYEDSPSFARAANLRWLLLHILTPICRRSNQSWTIRTSHKQKCWLILAFPPIDHQCATIHAISWPSGAFCISSFFETGWNNPWRRRIPQI